MTSGRKLRRVALVVAFAVAAVGIAFSGAAVGEILDPGADDPSEGPSLTEWEPQLVNSSTVDTYQVEIRADNPDEGITLIRQRPQVASEVTQRININESFGDAANPEIVAFEGDDGPQERIAKNVFLDDGDVVVELLDDSLGAQQQAKLTGVTIAFESESAPDEGFYNFSVEMQGQETIGGQTGDFETLDETGVAQVEVVGATPADPDDLDVTDVDTAAEATQDERQLEVNATIDNPTGDTLEDSLVYGLQEDADPAFDGTDLLTQQQNVTVEANSQETVTFFVDLTAEDEAINTGDDITHGVELENSGNSLTTSLTILDGPVAHSEDGGETLNRTTGLIQTAVDISDDADEDLVVVGLAGSPYGENVTVDVDNVQIVGEMDNGDRPAVAWTGPQVPDGEVNAPFTVTGASNTTIADLQVEPLIPEAGGIEIAGGAFHAVTDIEMEGTNTGPPGPGISVTDVDGFAVLDNAVANKSDGIALASATNGTVADNTVQNNDGQGIALQGSDNNLVSGNDVSDNVQIGIRLSNADGNSIENNSASESSTGIVLINGAQGNTVTGNTAFENGQSGILVQGGQTTGNTVYNNTATENTENGIRVVGGDNEVVSNDITGNEEHGILVVSADFVDVSSNTVTGNDWAGINLVETFGVTVEANEVTDQGQDGIVVDDADNSTVTGNTATGNAQTGIVVRFAGGTDAIDNTATGNGLAGIDVIQSAGTLVQGGVYSNNGDFGVLLAGADDNTVTDVEANDNAAVGVVLFDSFDNTFSDIESVGNEDWAYQVDNSTGNVVEGLNVGDSTAPNTTLSFEGESVQVGPSEDPPEDPGEVLSIDRYFDAQDTEDDAFLDIELAYEDGDVQDFDENSLELRRYDGTEWVEVPDSGVDTAENVVFANITEFSTFGAFGELDDGAGLSDLDIAGEGDSAVIAEGIDHDVTVNVTNFGADGNEVDVTLTIGEEVEVTETTAPLDEGQTETLVFENVTADLLISMDAYTVMASTEADSIEGELRVHPDVNGDGNPARDTTGDGLLNDINGDGGFDIFDVQVLFDFLDAPVVQDNAGFFQFAGTGMDRVSIFDIQGLFTELQAQG